MSKGKSGVSLSWGDYIGAINIMMTQCEKHIENLTDYTIVAIGRGGLIPAQMLAYRAKITKVSMVAVASYGGQERGQVHIHGSPVPFTLDTCPNQILLVDDLVDSGNTLAAVDHYIRQYASSQATIVQVHSAVVYRKDKVEAVWRPDVYGLEIGDVWVHFPYER